MGRLARPADFAPVTSTRRRLMPAVMDADHARTLTLDGWEESSAGDPVNRLLLVRSGQLDVQGASGSWLVPPGHIFFMLAHRAFTLRAAPGTRVTLVFLQERHTPWSHNGCWVAASSPLARAMIGQAASWTPDAAAANDQAQTFFRAIAGLCRDWFSNPRMLWVPSVRSAALRAALEHVEADLPRVDVKAAAAAGGLSVRTLQRRCQEELGMSWRQYLNEVRMVKAMAMLSTGPQAIADIAAATGFRSVGAFTRSFGSRLGTTPRGFARLCQDQPAAPSSLSREAGEGRGWRCRHVTGAATQD